VVEGENQGFSPPKIGNSPDFLSSETRLNERHIEPRSKRIAGGTKKFADFERENFTKGERRRLKEKIFS
jgi:hypothetical protein